MKVQSLSIVVPNQRCINSCKFCVSKMKQDGYKNQLNHNLPFYDLYLKDYLNRLEYARDNGCNTVMLTGNSEPQQNRQFLMTFGLLNQILEKPFRNIEMQTTGTLLNENYLRFLRNHVRVNTISLSLSSFDNIENAEICQMKNPIDIALLCALIKKYDFNLRLSLNMTKYMERNASELFSKCKELNADQVTIRKLYTSDNNTEEDKFIKKNKCKDSILEALNKVVTTVGTPLGILEYGATQYDYKGMSIVVDMDCMSKELKEEYKYWILREDCKLYSQWDSKASLVF